MDYKTFHVYIKCIFLQIYVYISNKGILTVNTNCRFEIEILACDYANIQDWTHNDSFAAFWRFYWNKRPGAFLIFNGKKTPMLPDNFFLIPSNSRFSTRSEHSFLHLYLHFTAESPFDRVIPGVYSFHVDTSIRKKIRELTELHTQTDYGRIRNSLLFYSLIYESIAKLEEENFISTPRMDPRIETALEVLNKNTSRPPGNEELAGKINMATNGFIRLFSSATGISPQKYSQKKRIEKASLLLSFSNKKIDEIAKETGFLDRYHFSKVFKKYTQQGPAEFRKSREFIF